MIIKEMHVLPLQVKSLSQMSVAVLERWERWGCNILEGKQHCYYKMTLFLPIDK